MTYSEVILPIFTESQPSEGPAVIGTCKYSQKAAFNLRALANFVCSNFFTNKCKTLTTGTLEKAPTGTVYFFDFVVHGIK